MTDIIDFILHIDDHLFEMVKNYGTLTYGILFLIIFAETGFIVTPFLPGDSLLFAAGVVAAASGALDPWVIILLCIIAGFIGNTINYRIGYWIGPKIFEQEKIRFIKKEYLVKTHNFYEKHGGKAVVIGRFMPIIRTFVPFVAGIGQMDWKRFMGFNFLGAVLWVIPFTLAGFYLGEHPFVKKNFELIMLVIIVVTVLPSVYGVLAEFIKSRKIAA